MLQILDTINKSIILKPVTGVQWTSAWGDSFGSSFVEGSWQGTSSSSSDSNVVPAPGANTRRVIKSVTLYNSSSEVKEVVLVFKDGGNEVIISKASLAPNETWYSSKTSTSLLATGNKGDITVNGNGSWTINTNAVTSTKILDGAVTSSKIALDSVTYAQLQPVSFSNRLLGRGSTAGTLDVEEISIGTGLSMSGTTLNNTGVTSVGLSAPSFLTVSGSPVTTSGTLTLALATQTANTVFAGPTTGIAAAPTFRALVAGDIPDLSSIYQPLDADLTAIAALTANGLLRKTAGVWAMDSASYLTTNQTITLSGDVTGSGTTAITATIANDAVTYAKMQNMAADRVLGRRSTTGDPEELTLTQTLDLDGTAAQGDILYRGASTWTRLAAGTRGRYLQTGGASANPNWVGVLGSKNLLINGDMSVAQRGTSFSSTTTPANNDRTYLLDRWYLLSDGNNRVTVARSTTAPTGRLYSCELKVVSGQTNRKFGIAQIIEQRNCHHVLGSKVSLSFQVRISNTRLSNIRAAVYAWNGTADTFTSATRDIVNSWEDASSTNNPTLSANYTLQGSTPVSLAIPAANTWYQQKIENIQINTTEGSPATNVTNLVVFIWSNAISTQADDAVYISDVQLEPGEVVTEYDVVPYDVQEARCQRYLPIGLLNNVTHVDHFFGSGQPYDNTGKTCLILINLNVRPRVAPTGITFTAGNFEVYDLTTVRVGNVTGAVSFTGGFFGCLLGVSATDRLSNADMVFTAGGVTFMTPRLGVGDTRILLFGCEL